MPDAKKKVVQVFNAGETMDDEAGAREELGEGQVPVQEPPVEGGQPPVEAPPAEAPADDAETKMVPRARLNEVIRARDEAIARERQLQENWARLDERQKQAREAREAAQQQAQATQQAAQRPDPNIDPVGAELFDLRQFRQSQEQWRQQAEQAFYQLQGNYQQAQQNNDFNNWVVAEAQSFIRQQPDYVDAANHLASWRMNWWIDAGFPPPTPGQPDFNQQGQPITAKGMVMAESNMYTTLCRQTGKNFPSIFYKMAQATGYQGRAANGNGNGNGVSPAVSAAGRTLAQAARGQSVQGMNRMQSAGNEARSRYATMTAAEIAAVPDDVWQRDYANPQLKLEMDEAMRRLDGIAGSGLQYFSGR